MKLSRDEIIGGDFAQAVDGWHRGDVLRHLNAIAAAVEALKQSGEPIDREEQESAQREAGEMLAAARAEANTVRAQAAEDAERQMNQAQLAVKDLLERVASLNLGVEEARRAVQERGQEMARRLEESAAPFVGGMRERAESLGAEVELMATGLAVSARAVAERDAQPEPQPEPEAEVKAEPEVKPEPEPEAKPEPESEPQPETKPDAKAEAKSDAEPGTGLTPGDLDDAVDELAADATPDHDAPGQQEDDPRPDEADGGGAQAGRERARLVALNMALGGAPEEEAERRLREDLGVDDPDEILDDVYGPARERR